MSSSASDRRLEGSWRTGGSRDPRSQVGSKSYLNKSWRPEIHKQASDPPEPKGQGQSPQASGPHGSLSRTQKKRSDTATWRVAKGNGPMNPSAPAFKPETVDAVQRRIDTILENDTTKNLDSRADQALVTEQNTPTAQPTHRSSPHTRRPNIPSTTTRTDLPTDSKKSEPPARNNQQTEDNSSRQPAQESGTRPLVVNGSWGYSKGVKGTNERVPFWQDPDGPVISWPKSVAVRQPVAQADRPNTAQKKVLISQNKRDKSVTNREAPLSLQMDMRVPIHNQSNMTPAQPFHTPTMQKSMRGEDRQYRPTQTVNNSAIKISETGPQSMYRLCDYNAPELGTGVGHSPWPTDPSYFMANMAQEYMPYAGDHSNGVFMDSENGRFVHPLPAASAGNVGAASSSDMFYTYLTTLGSSSAPGQYLETHAPTFASSMIDTSPKFGGTANRGQEAQKGFLQSNLSQSSYQLSEVSSTSHIGSRHTTPFSKTSSPEVARVSYDHFQTKGDTTRRQKPDNRQQATTQRDSLQKDRRMNTASYMDGPPLTAPTGPALVRKASKYPNIPQQTVSAQTSADSGSWSHSKRWTSQATKERTAYYKLMHNLHHIGASKSPFIPQNPAELAALRADIAEAEKRKLTREVERRLARNRSEASNGGQKDSSSKREVELFGGKKVDDFLSPVFASESCFNQEIPDGSSSQAVWPSLAELKEEGDKRAIRYSRYLPLPRTNVVAERILQNEGNKAFNSDGSIPWDKRSIKLELDNIRPVTAPEPETEEAVEIDPSELSPWMQSLLEEIDQDTQEDEIVENQQ